MRISRVAQVVATLQITAPLLPHGRLEGSFVNFEEAHSGHSRRSPMLRRTGDRCLRYAVESPPAVGFSDPSEDSYTATENEGVVC